LHLIFLFYFTFSNSEPPKFCREEELRGGRKMAEVEEEYSGPTGLYDPEDMREEILALLPLECLCRSRTCKNWNTPLSSTKFVTSRWVEHLQIESHGCFCANLASILIYHNSKYDGSLNYLVFFAI
jgi:hypothetical protein